MVLAPLAQHPVKAGFRCDPDALVGQSRHDLAGGKAGELRSVAGCHDVVALLIAQLAGGRGALGKGATIIADFALRPRPALQGACVQAKLGTGGSLARAGRPGLADQSNDVAAI